VTELVVEFGSSAYMTDTQLSRLKRIPEFQAYRSWKDLVEYVEHVIKNFGTEYEINFA